MKFILITILYISVLFIIIGFIQSKQVCPAPKIVYRYVPRTFEEEQLDAVSVDSIFQDMFNKSSPLVDGYQQVDIPNKKGEISNDFQNFFTT